MSERESLGVFSPVPLPSGRAAADVDLADVVSECVDSYDPYDEFGLGQDFGDLRYDGNV